MTRGTSLCPLTPPSAFCMSMRALKPAGESPSWVAPSPVTEVMYAMVMGDPVADVLGVELPLEQPAAAIGRVTAAASSTFLIVRCTGIVPPCWVPIVDDAMKMNGCGDRRAR